MEHFAQFVGIKIFDHLNPKQIEKIKNIAVKREFEKNEILFLENDESSGFFLIIDGTVKVFKNTSDGKEQTLAILKKGAMAGLVPVLENSPFHASAIAITKSSFLFFSKEEFINLITTDPKLFQNITAVLSNRLKCSSNIITLLSNPKIDVRIASYIMGLARDQNNDKSVSLSISKKNIANLLGITPETLSRVFSKMTNSKIIEVDGNNIKIVDFKKLAELAEHIDI